MTKARAITVLVTVLSIQLNENSVSCQGQCENLAPNEQPNHLFEFRPQFFTEVPSQFLLISSLEKFLFVPSVSVSVSQPEQELL